MAETQTHMMPHTGGCHCKAVRYEVTGDFSHAMEGNCSICTAKGLLIAPAQMDAFRIVSGENNLSEYQFHRHIIHHMTCKTCGTQPFARGVGPHNTPMMAINVRTLDGIDLAKVERKPFNCRAM